jgi:general secretion pathway protein I
MRSSESGFTLIEVMVALAIVAVALAASVRAVGMIAQNNAALRSKSLALVSADNAMTVLRLSRIMPSAGAQTVACPQGLQPLQCEEIFTNSANSNIRQVTIRVHPDSSSNDTLVQVNGFLTALP